MGWGGDHDSRTRGYPMWSYKIALIYIHTIHLIQALILSLSHPVFLVPSDPAAPPPFCFLLLATRYFYLHFCPLLPAIPTQHHKSQPTYCLCLQCQQLCIAPPFAVVQRPTFIRCPALCSSAVSLRPPSCFIYFILLRPRHLYWLLLPPHLSSTLVINEPLPLLCIIIHSFLAFFNVVHFYFYFLASAFVVFHFYLVNLFLKLCFSFSIVFTKHLFLKL